MSISKSNASYFFDRNFLMYFNEKVSLLFKISPLDIETNEGVKKMNENVKNPKAPNNDHRKFRERPPTLNFDLTSGALQILF